MLIGLTGFRGSGKTTVAQMLQGRGFVRMRFASPLKAMLLSLGLTQDEIDGSLKEAPCDLLNGKTPRWAMQSLGTEWGRDLISANLWVNVMRRNLERTPAAHVVIDDVRFSNEVDLIHDLGGKVWRISRIGIATDVHASESGIAALSVDHELANNGPLDTLHDAVIYLASY